VLLVGGAGGAQASTQLQIPVSASGSGEVQVLLQQLQEALQRIPGDTAAAAVQQVLMCVQPSQPQALQQPATTLLAPEVRAGAACLRRCKSSEQNSLPMTGLPAQGSQGIQPTATAVPTLLMSHTHNILHLSALLVFCWPAGCCHDELLHVGPAHTQLPATCDQQLQHRQPRLGQYQPLAELL
jgi:hypothetical protein